ncbi:hypothetical protein PHJA_000467200 [Phtheirospermum japonicum]|uniref:Uncharacterized protein n=1 Tax=Phtheirospermum japonicum TaxID=374723 RepID=A0A830BDM5_9LAMI|nr:hypothetical protein PHJA_000467200 [Phtheirospermum japonicum]
MGDLPEGGAAAELKPLASPSSSCTEQNPFHIGTDNWVTAERAARYIIQKVQPNPVSEDRRKKVVEFIQRLIRSCLGAEVFPYGSVPLKTYLPEGDIDLTTFGCANTEDTLVDDMKLILEEEEKNASSVFVVKDVQLIRAEVKLVKCIVEDIVVDISFNQIGGLCSLCFLEQVDRLIGKDHLFKRSIILIKSWCYYESRILGAHHGLISTYALETMVLYIFHLFHSTLDGPLAVLFKFLDYFSNFDWEAYCISLSGPVRVSSLPAFIVEMPEGSDKDLLLSSEFLSSCVGMFSVPAKVADISRGFQQKYLNIFDPLKEINNLGRSVSKGNFYRIRSAFAYGARKLSLILSQPSDSIANELHKFFPNTMARHGGQRPDVQDIALQASNSNEASHAVGAPHLAPHLYFSNSNPEDSNHTGSEEGPPESSSSSGLSGDYEWYMRCLHYGRFCYEINMGMRSMPLPPLSATPYPNSGPWDGMLPVSHYKPNGFPYPRYSGPRPGPAPYGVQPMLLPGVNQPPQGYRPSLPMKGKNQAPPRPVRNNGRNTMFPEPNVPERNSHEVPQCSPRRDGHLGANGSFSQSEEVAVLDSSASPTFVPEKSRRQKPASSSPRNLSGVQRSEPSLHREPDRILLGSSYRLKDEDDFPPLPGGVEAPGFTFIVVYRAKALPHGNGQLGHSGKSGPVYNPEGPAQPCF